ncbi:hypothetical protein [Marinicrinis sediminis]|uniref:Uncharacterized protein n=1 Tax=Marinicrinis sediminis TaxID=1652465 RepID=A0ABW5R9Q3_9BACL
MKINVHIAVKEQHVLEDTITVEEETLAELSDEEIEQVIEIRIRDWVDRNLQVAWEAEREME